MQIQKVGIIGAGAIGGYFIWGLSDKLKDNLVIIAEGDRADKLKNDGIIINEKRYELNVKSAKEVGTLDLLLVATKYNGLTSALDAIEKVVGPETVVMSLLNGVDSEDTIAERIGYDRIVYSFMKIESERKDGKIKFNGDVTPGVFFGEKNNEKVSERMLAICDLFAGTNIHFTTCEDIVKEIWSKFSRNIGYNLPQAIVGCGCGAYADSEHVKYISTKLMEEVYIIARAKGIDLNSAKNANANSKPATKTARYSTLQDLNAKRHTEIDMFSGAVVKMGEEMGIDTPYNRLVFHIIKAFEEKNDGLFDY